MEILHGQRWDNDHRITTNYCVCYDVHKLCAPCHAYFGCNLDKIDVIGEMGSLDKLGDSFLDYTRHALIIKQMT